jgi:hypothetical protein
MRAEAFRRLQDPAPPQHATDFRTAERPLDLVHELSGVLSRLVETQELLIREVREAAQRPVAAQAPDAPETPCEDPVGGTVVTYEWAPSPPPPPSPW